MRTRCRCSRASGSPARFRSSPPSSQRPWPALRRARSLRSPAPASCLALTGDPGASDGREREAGISLVPWITEEREAAGPERLLYSELATLKAVRRGPHELIRWLGPRGRVVAFDLEADPEERSSVAAAPWRRDLAAALQGFRDAEPAHAVPVDAEPVDPDTARRLEALGYGLPEEPLP